jgi:hypothetical protein
LSTYLLDANVLIALTVVEHEHHDRASEWLGQVEASGSIPGAFRAPSPSNGDTASRQRSDGRSRHTTVPTPHRSHDS